MKADKECSKCEETKALTEFHKDKTEILLGVRYDIMVHY